MSYYGTTDWLIQVSKGQVPGHSIIHQFGKNTAVGSSLAPVCNGGNYQTPTSAASLEILSDQNQDQPGGNGAHKVTVQGLNSSWNEITEEVTLSGTTAVALSNQFIRVYGMYVSESGRYANQAQASQRGTLTLRGAGGGVTWATIPTIATNFGAGESLIGAYTVPAGFTAFILSQIFSIDGNKSANLYFFNRSDANDVSSPYTGIMKAQSIYTGASSVYQFEHKANESYSEYTDIGFLANYTSGGTASIAVEFELLLIENTYL